LKVYKISAVTLIIKNMERSCNFYSRIPGFKLVYGGSGNDTFTSYEIGTDTLKMYLNLELLVHNSYNHTTNDKRRRKHFGRIIFHTEDVDKLYWYLKGDEKISNMISFENVPADAPWGERYFHVRDPDGYQLSFAKTINEKRKILKP
jgi:catechol 2,3-dioxygenase-like lactoylglutathione lyase family enzyme